MHFVGAKVINPLNFLLSLIRFISSKTYGLMHLFLSAYPLNPDVATFQRSVKKTSTAGEDIFINR